MNSGNQSVTKKEITETQIQKSDSNTMSKPTFGNVSKSKPNVATTKHVEIEAMPRAGDAMDLCLSEAKLLSLVLARTVHERRRLLRNAVADL